MSKHKETNKSKSHSSEEEVLKENFGKDKEVSDNQTEKNDLESSFKSEMNYEELLAVEKDKFLRLFAEFENYKKRTLKERLDLFKTANKELMAALLPVLDDFERALAELKKSDDDELFKGVELIQSKFRNTLEQKGLTLMQVKQGGDFDAEIHQAITQIPAPTPDLKGKIIDVTENGYTLGDAIIRFPKVVVGN